MSEYTNKYKVESVLSELAIYKSFECYDWKLNYTGEVLMCFCKDASNNRVVKLYMDLHRYIELVVRRLSDNVIVFSYGGKYL